MNSGFAFECEMKVFFYVGYIQHTAAKGLTYYQTIPCFHTTLLAVTRRQNDIIINVETTS